MHLEQGTPAYHFSLKPAHRPPSLAVVDLTVNLEKGASYDDVMAELKRASEQEMAGILG